MKKYSEKIKSILETIEKRNSNLTLWSAGFLSIISLRLFIELLLYKRFNADIYWVFYEISHTILFFFFSFLVFSLIVKKTLKTTLKETSNIILFGYFIILTPPIIDFILSKGKGFWSFYEFSSLWEMPLDFITIFGKTPEVGITQGVRIEIFLMLTAIFIYGYLRSEKLTTSLRLTLFSYLAFFVLGTLPSWIAILFQGIIDGWTNISESHIAQMFLTVPKIFSQPIGDITSSLNIKMSMLLSLIVIPTSLTLLYSDYSKKIKIFLKNIRVAQIVLHIGIFLFGAGLSIIFTPVDWDFNFFSIIATLVIAQSVVLSWITSVTVNDICDQKIDKISNSNRPLITEEMSPSEYKTIGIASFLLSVFFAYIVSGKIALLLLVYQALAWIYSAPPFRFKKFAFLSTFISATALITIFLCGFILTDPAQTLANLPKNIAWLLLISFTISLPIKDLKDIRGDKKDGIYTIPVIFGEYWGKTIIASGIFISFILSVILLNEFDMLWWAILFGGMSFWTVQYSNQSKRVTYKNINWWLLSILFAYTLILIFSVFL